MIENTKCECGHQNAVGTVLCESCGKPLFEDEKETAPLEMRYDGVARRSQRSNPTWIDRIWNFFSSVKVAVWLILLTLAGASLGTIYPQETTFFSIDPSTYYRETYGTLGHIYYLLGLSNTYGSWWFIALLVMIGASLVICSLDRVLPLYRALGKQQIRKHLQFLKRQKVVCRTGLQADDEAAVSGWMDKFAERLSRRGYRIHRDGTALLAEKHRFSRWGPYVNHIGLIIFLLAVLARQIPGWHMDTYMGFLEGEIVPIPDTPYYLKNEQFSVEVYGEDEMSEEFAKQGKLVPKLFETKAVLYECTARCAEPGAEPELKEVARHDIRVNEPFEYEGLLLYQFDFAETPQLVSVTPTLRNRETGEAIGKLTLSMKHPGTQYEVGPYKLELVSFYPEVDLNEKQELITVSNEPKAPAFVFQITGGDAPSEGYRYLYFPRPVDKERFGQDRINELMGSKLELAVDSMQTDVEIASYTSFLNVRKDEALPYIWIGAAIFMIGVVQGLYWQHRRIWLRIDGRQLTLGAHTNKNWYGLRHETAQALKSAGLDVEPKSLENGGTTA